MILMPASARKTEIPGLGVVGFSLLELTIVITVIGVLLGFGISAWFSVKSSQQVTVAATVVRTASECLENYVILTGKIPPVSFFTERCTVADPWHNQLLYENVGDDTELKTVVPKTFKDEYGRHPDAVWIIASGGMNGLRDVQTSALQWDCSAGDDICQVVSKNRLLYELGK